MKTVELSKRDIRQETGVDKWYVDKRGTLQYATGVGKTQTCVIAIRRLLLENPRLRVLIVVPTIGLREQWEGILKEAVPGLRFKVFVINTLVLREQPIECDFLCLDECHRFAADTFSKIFTLAQYSYIMGLTATMERLDGKEELIMKYCPIVDSINLNEARSEGYVANYKEYNLGLNLSVSDKQKYDQITKDYNTSFAWFHFDMDLAFKCMTAYHKEYARENNIEEKMVLMQALKWNRNMQARKELLYNNESKFITTCEVLQRINTKTIVFSESIEFAEKISNYFDSEAVMYSSKLTSKKRTDVLKRYQDNQFRIISTVKALNEGFDCPDIMLGVISSRTSSKTAQIQRVGRVVRNYTFPDGKVKNPVVINLYVKDTQDEKWLKSAQVGSKRIQTVSTIDELVTQINESM